VHTIPAQLGVFAAKILAGFCLVAALACGYVLRLNPFSAAAILVSMLFVIFANGSRGAWYYHAIVLVWIIPLLLVLA
jgi:hypothetical protein